MENKVLTDITQIPNLLCNYIESLDYRRNLSPHSLRAYSSDLLQVFQMKEFGAIRGPKLGGETSYYWEVKQNLPEDGGIALKKRIQESVASWGKLAPKSRRRKFSALNSFIDWLKAEKKLEIPWLTPPSKTPPTKIPNFLSVDECMSLISYLEKPINDEAFHQQKLLFYLLYGCGLRVSEACGLLRENISFEKRQIRLWGKGGKQRIAVMPGKVVEVLKASLSSPRPFVFGDEPLPTRTAYERIRQLGKVGGLLKPLNPHALRHSYASHLLASGSDLRVLQQLLGHQSLAATEIYTHLDVDQLARSMEEYHPLSKKNKD